jgi:transcriptional regulator with XRE-family HTH domain
MTLLRELREKSRLSLTDLGRARNLSVSALSQAERRKAVPSKRIRRELRLILMKKGITVQDFLADTITKYVRDNVANEPAPTIATNAPDTEVA